MGIDYDGGMIVGCIESEIYVPDDYDGDEYDYFDEHEMRSYSFHYDADEDCRIRGFPIDDVNVDDINDEWLSKIKELGKKFKELTGHNATLYGTQNIH